MLLACPNCATTYDIKAAVIGENGRSLRCARCQVVWFATRSQELIPATQPAAEKAADDAASPPGNDFAASLSPDSFRGAQSQPPSENGAIGPTPATDPPPNSLATSIESPPLAPAAPNAAPTTGNAALSVEGEDIETFARRHSKYAPTRAQRIRAQFGAPAVIAILGVVVAALLAWRVTIVQHAPQLASFYASIGLPVNLRQLTFGDVRTSKEVRDGVPVLLVDGTITSTGRYPVEVPRLRFALRNRSGQEIFSWTALAEQSILPPGETMPFRSRLASPPSEGYDVVVRFFNKRDATEGAR